MLDVKKLELSKFFFKYSTKFTCIHLSVEENSICSAMNIFRQYRKEREERPKKNFFQCKGSLTRLIAVRVKRALNCRARHCRLHERFPISDVTDTSGFKERSRLHV